MEEINAKQAKENCKNNEYRLEQIFKEIKSASECGSSYVIIYGMDIFYESKLLSLGFQISRHTMPDGTESTKVKWN